MKLITYGIEKNKNSALSLVKESAKNYEINGFLGSPQNVFDFVEATLDLSNKAEEYVYIIAVNAKNKVLGISEISHGDETSSMISNKAIMSRLLLMNACRFFLIHNHPSGNFAPSRQDADITEKLKKASDIMQIEMLDHVIISTEGYYSFKEAREM